MKSKWAVTLIGLALFFSCISCSNPAGSGGALNAITSGAFTTRFTPWGIAIMQ